MRQHYSKRMAAVLAMLAGIGTGAQAQVAGDPARGEALAAGICVGCHGADGNSPVPNFPKLAGQQAEYMLKQLQEFAGARRENEIMKPIVATLTPGDMADAAAFFATQRGSPGEVADPSLLPAGRKVYEDGNPDTGVPACAGCHGPNGIGNARYPRLAGQHSAYVLDQMQRFADGRRTNDKRLMQTVASRLSEAETRAVAEYIAGMLQETKP